MSGVAHRLFQHTRDHMMGTGNGDAVSAFALHLHAFCSHIHVSARVVFTRMVHRACSHKVTNSAFAPTTRRTTYDDDKKNVRPASNGWRSGYTKGSYARRLFITYCEAELDGFVFCTNDRMSEFKTRCCCWQWKSFVRCCWQLAQHCRVLPVWRSLPPRTHSLRQSHSEWSSFSHLTATSVLLLQNVPIPVDIHVE